MCNLEPAEGWYELPGMSRASGCILQTPATRWDSYGLDTALSRPLQCPSVPIKPLLLLFEPLLLLFELPLLLFEPRLVLFEPRHLLFETRLVLFEPRLLLFEPRLLLFELLAVSL